MCNTCKNGLLHSQYKIYIDETLIIFQILSKIINHINEVKRFQKSNCGDLKKMKIFEKMITMVINIEFNITALTTDFQSCKETCDGLSGYI